MKRIWPLVLVLALGACHKKHDDGTSGQTGGMPGGGVTTTAHYAGALTPQCSPCVPGHDWQDITVGADVLAYPSDRVDVFMCRHQASCVTLPPTQCPSQDNGQPCWRSTPSAHIAYGSHYVRFIDAPEDGYVSYSIDTTITR